MSHFSVAVFSRTPDEVDQLLAPYAEDPSDEEYLEFQSADESIEELRISYAQNRKGSETFEDYLSRGYGYTYNEEQDEAGYLCNPNAKWDWWVIGGRWGGMLRLKSGCPGNSGAKSWTNRDIPSQEGWCDQARLKDVDLMADQPAYDRAARFWEVYIEGKRLRKGEQKEDFDALYRREYYLEQFGTKEAYAHDAVSFPVWAFVTLDGEWHEKGDMGWFGSNNATKDSRKSFSDELCEALANVDPDCYITIVDCHI